MLGPVWVAFLLVPRMGCWLMVCWPRHEMLVTGSQNLMLVDGLLVPCMGSGCAGAPAKVYLAYCDQFGMLLSGGLSTVLHAPYCNDTFYYTLFGISD